MLLSKKRINLFVAKLKQVLQKKKKNFPKSIILSSYVINICYLNFFYLKTVFIKTVSSEIIDSHISHHLLLSPDRTEHKSAGLCGDDHLKEIK